MSEPKTFYQVADEFGKWFDQPKIERLQPVSRHIAQVNLNALTPYELEWLREDAARAALGEGQ